MEKMSNPILYSHDKWTVETARTNPRWLFVFSDNVLKIGYRGQTVIRREPNTVGIPTKKTPRSYSSAFYKDEEYEWNSHYIQKGVEAVWIEWIENRDRYDRIVFCEEVLARIEEAPLTDAYLAGALYALLEMIRVTP